jgi:hypothetical protein
VHHLLPALVVFVFVLIFVVEVAVAAVLLVTAFAMMRAWLQTLTETRALPR